MAGEVLELARKTEFLAEEPERQGAFGPHPWREDIFLRLNIL